VFVGIYFRSAACGFISFLAGFVIDADHLIDYYCVHRFTLNLRKIYYTCLHMRLERMYLLLHSYELAAVFWIVIYYFSLSNVWKAAAIGMTQHIALDALTNPLSGLGYFIIYRMSKGFKIRLLMKGLKYHGRT